MWWQVESVCQHPHASLAGVKRCLELESQMRPNPEQTDSTADGSGTAVLSAPADSLLTTKAQSNFSGRPQGSPGNQPRTCTLYHDI